MKRIPESERCQAIVPDRYGSPHRCHYQGASRGVGHQLCGMHWRALERGNPLHLSGGRRLQRHPETGVLHSVIDDGGPTFP